MDDEDTPRVNPDPVLRKIKDFPPWAKAWHMTAAFVILFIGYAVVAAGLFWVGLVNVSADGSNGWNWLPSLLFGFYMTYRGITACLDYEEFRRNLAKAKEEYAAEEAQREH